MHRLSTFTFCKDVRPKQNYTQFIWSLWGPYKARVQNGSYMDAIFKLVADDESDLYKSTTLFYKERSTTALRVVEFVYTWQYDYPQ